MADYVPFPTGEGEVVDDRRLTRRILGCFGCGGLSVLGFFGVMTLLIGSLGTVDGCDIDVGDPGQGTESLRLDVDVAPVTGLDDGAVVRVTSDAFEPDTIVGVAVCLRAADTERRGVAACDEDQGARYATSSSGTLDATYPVPRIITVGTKAYDCAGKARRCLVVAADASDYDTSGGMPVTFAADLPEVEVKPDWRRPTSDHLPIGADPSVADGAVAPGTDLTVLASGFQPDEPLLIAYRTSELERRGVVETCEPLDSSAAVAAIMFRSVSGDFPRADASGAFTTKLDARATVAPYGEDISRALEDIGSTTTTSSVSTTGGSSTTTAPKLREGEVRCTEAAGGCSIVIAAAADTKRSAVLPYVVAG